MIWLTFEKPFDLFEVEKSLCKFPEYLDWNLARKNCACCLFERIMIMTLFPRRHDPKSSPFFGVSKNVHSWQQRLLN